jgi:hypothetical protein
MKPSARTEFDDEPKDVAMALLNHRHCVRRHSLADRPDVRRQSDTCLGRTTRPQDRGARAFVDLFIRHGKACQGKIACQAEAGLATSCFPD